MGGKEKESVEFLMRNSALVIYRIRNLISNLSNF